MGHTKKAIRILKECSMTAVARGRHFFNHHAQHWDDQISQTEIERISNLFSKYITKLNDPVLDMGSGTGVLIPVLTSEYSLNTIVEFDIAENMLQSAKKKYQNQNALHFIHGDGHKPPFADNAFATVLCFSVFPHFSNRHLIIKEFRRILKTNGRFIIMHLMDHYALNQLHSDAGEAVSRDMMIPAGELAQFLVQFQFTCERVIEQSDLYLVDAHKI
ncbi:MAG: methyltransferase domain-containing protein [Caldithrix sp.]|nr:methyltransferase domain-containing protein [Caldithrix sp.]